jgi:hypothetical protein
MKQIPLKGKYGEGKCIAVSDCDYDTYKDKAMTLAPIGYVMLYKPPRKTEYLHREIMGCQKGDGTVVDHIDGNKLNCCRENLNITTQSKNASNRGKVSFAQPLSSKFIGVTKRKGKFSAYITKDGVRHFVGSYQTEQEAAFAYNRKAIQLHSTYATLNIVNGRVFPENFLSPPEIS